MASTTYPPHHIKSVSINSAGWVVPSARVNDELKSDQIAITKCCQTLLRELKLDLSDVFPSNQSPDTDKAPTSLTDLIHRRDIASLVIKVVNTIRRMGDTHESTDSDDKKKSRTRDGKLQGKIAQLEEQRRIRKQKEQSNGDNEEGFIPVGEVAESLNEVSLDERFAMTFNSLRVLIAIIRPVLDHPQRQDYDIKMKKGPSIDRGTDKKAKKKARNNYLFFDHVYDCVTVGTVKELDRDIKRMLEDLELSSDVVMKWKKDGVYQHDMVNEIKFILGKGHGCMNKAIVTDQCFRSMPKNFDPLSQLHEALMKRFDSANDDKQIALKESIDELVQKLDKAISDRFSKDSRLTVYGSCLSGLNLNHSHDVDISVHIPLLQKIKQEFHDGKITAAQYEKRTRSVIFQVRDALLNNKKYGDSFINVQPITQARVPVVKGVDKNSRNPYSPDGHLHFDLCFGNEIAVVNSSLLREYSLLDTRVRVLMLCVKSFAKTNGISSAADATFSSYSWLNLVVFYLQCIGFLPVLQSPELMETHKFKPDIEGNIWHSVNSLETYYLSSNEVLKSGIWKQPDRYADTTMPELLYGFFCFYCEVFPRDTVTASIRVGECSIHKAAFVKSSKLWRLCVEDPFETWDSHFPHDLGSPLSEDGQQKTTQCLKDGLAAIRLVLESNMRPTDKIFALFAVLDLPQKYAENERGGRKRQRKKLEKQTTANDTKHKEEPRQQAQNGSGRNQQMQQQQPNKNKSGYALKNGSNDHTNNTTLDAIQQMKDLALENKLAQLPIKKHTHRHIGTKRPEKTTYLSEEGTKNNDEKDARSENEWNPHKDKTCFLCGLTGHINKNCHMEKVCKNCGLTGHINKNCPANKVCRNCGVVGHFARDCHQKPILPHKKKVASWKGRKSKINTEGVSNLVANAE